MVAYSFRLVKQTHRVSDLDKAVLIQTINEAHVQSDVRSESRLLVPDVQFGMCMSHHDVKSDVTSV